MDDIINKHRSILKKEIKVTKSINNEHSFNPKYYYKTEKMSGHIPQKYNIYFRKEDSNKKTYQPHKKKENDSSKKPTHIIISPFATYFLCNEKYIKENNPNGNRYKNKSKNYILKKNLSNTNKIKKEDVSSNKYNDIFEDITFSQNNTNNNNFYNNNIYNNNYYNNNYYNNININFINNKNYNLNILPNKQFNLINNYNYDNYDYYDYYDNYDNNLLNPYINIYKLNSKYFFY